MHHVSTDEIVTDNSSSIGTCHNTKPFPHHEWIFVITDGFCLFIDLSYFLIASIKTHWIFIGVSVKSLTSSPQQFSLYYQLWYPLDRIARRRERFFVIDQKK